MSPTHLAIANPVVRIKDVCRELGICRRTFDYMRERGEGPTVLRLSARAIGVRRNELERWLAEREHMAAAKPKSAPHLRSR